MAFADLTRKLDDGHQPIGWAMVRPSDQTSHAAIAVSRHQSAPSDLSTGSWADIIYRPLIDTHFLGVSFWRKEPNGAKRSQTKPNGARDIDRCRRYSLCLHNDTFHLHRNLERISWQSMMSTLNDTLVAPFQIGFSFSKKEINEEKKPKTKTKTKTRRKQVDDVGD